MTGENPTPIQTTTSRSTEVIVITVSPQKSSGSTSSYSSLNLNSWDGLFDENLKDVSNNNTPFNQNLDNFVDSSVTGEEVPSGPSVTTLNSSLPGPSTIDSALEPIVLDSTPEETPPVAT